MTQDPCDSGHVPDLRVPTTRSAGPSPRTARLGHRRNALLALSLLAVTTNVALASGNVTVERTASTWRIRGDDLANAIVIEPLTNATIRIRGSSTRGNTTVNRRAFVDIDTSLPIRIEMRGGDDSVLVRGTSSRPLNLSALTCDLGAGVDTLQVSYAKLRGRLTIDAGDGSATGPIGYETITLQNCEMSDLDFDTDRRAGSNSLSVSICTIRGSVRIDGSDGTNSVQMSSTRIDGSLAVDLHDESNASLMSDSLSLTSMNVGRAVSIDLGRGRSTTNLSSITAGAVSIDIGDYANDQIIVRNARFPSLRVRDHGGSRDRISGTGNRIGSIRLIGVEVNQLR